MYETPWIMQLACTDVVYKYGIAQFKPNGMYDDRNAVGMFCLPFASRSSGWLRNIPTEDTIAPSRKRYDNLCFDGIYLIRHDMEAGYCMKNRQACNGKLSCQVKLRVLYLKQFISTRESQNAFYGIVKSVKSESNLPNLLGLCTKISSTTTEFWYTGCSH